MPYEVRPVFEVKHGPDGPCVYGAKGPSMGTLLAKPIGNTRLVLLPSYISNEQERMYAINGVANFLRWLGAPFYATYSGKGPASAPESWSLVYKDSTVPLSFCKFVDIGRDVYKALTKQRKKPSDTQNMRDKEVMLHCVGYRDYTLVKGVIKDVELNLARVYKGGSMQIVAEPDRLSLRMVKELLRRMKDPVKIEDCSAGAWVIKNGSSWSVYKIGAKASARKERMSFVNTIRCSYIVHEIMPGVTVSLPVPIPVA